MLGLAPQGGKGRQRDGINIPPSCPGRVRFASSPLNRFGLRSCQNMWNSSLCVRSTSLCLEVEKRLFLTCDPSGF